MDSLPHLIFDTQKFLTRRKNAIARTKMAAKNPWFLHDFAVEENVETVGAVLQNFESALEIFSCNGQFRQKLLEEGLLGEGKKVQSLLEVEAQNIDYSNVQCISQIQNIGLDGQKYDLIVSNSGFNFVNDLPGFLIKIRNSLNEGGCFIASFIGNASLNELRQSFLNCEIEEFGGATMRISPMVEAESAVKLLTRAGFKSPVSSFANLKVRFDNVFDLFRDIKGMGENAAFVHKNEKHLNRRLIAKIADYYQDNFQDDDGRVYATFDIVTICGWA